MIVFIDKYLKFLHPKHQLENPIWEVRFSVAKQEMLGFSVQEYRKNKLFSLRFLHRKNVSEKQKVYQHDNV